MRVVLLLAFIAACATGCRTNPQPITGIANELRHKISPYWTIDTSKSTISIKSKDIVYLVGKMQPPFTPEELKNEEGGPTEEELFKEFGLRTNYVVTLSFVPRFTSADLKKIREERQPYERTRRTLSNYREVQRELDKYPLPDFYTENYSIFMGPPGFGCMFIPQRHHSKWIV